MEPLEQSIARELARFGTVPGLAEIVDTWPEAVGREIARNAWPARLSRDGTLAVHASSAAWAFELGQLEPTIRGLFQGVPLTRVRFVVGPLPEPEPEAREPRRGVAEPSPVELATAASLAAPIADESLREIVAKTAALSLASAADGRSLW
jgi:hypothetical protein